MKVSLIVATINRVTEVELFLNAMLYSTYKKFDIFLIDQNKDERLDKVISKYSSRLEIFHIKSSVKGLSYNRNIGMKMATGDILAFPDDDCTYYPDTLEKVMLKFQSDNVDFISGRIFDREKKISVIKNWPTSPKEITMMNFYSLSSSITIFAKVKQNDSIRFDENLGVGTIHGSCEDPDFLVALLKRGLRGVYVPSVEVNHPIPDACNTPMSKRISYAAGFGFMLGKYNKDIIFTLMGIGFSMKNIIRLAIGELSFSNLSDILSSMYGGYKDGKALHDKR